MRHRLPLPGFFHRNFLTLQLLLQLHGTARQILYQNCGARYEAEPLVAQFLSTNQVPACRQCTPGRLMHATSSFGQALSTKVLEQGIEWCQQADLLLAIGSSLVVSPAANLSAITKQRGGRLIIINRDPTPLDELADEVVHDSISFVLQTVDGQ